MAAELRIKTAMKICFDSTSIWDYSALTLVAESVLLDGFILRYRVWCPHCADYHYHGPRNGHREAHCHVTDSPFHKSGYNIECKT